jgi:hypothetical protein
VIIPCRVWARDRPKAPGSSFDNHPYLSYMANS